MNAEDWEVELARSISEYAGFVDANVLQYMWPEDFDMYRILMVRTFLFKFFLWCGLNGILQLVGMPMRTRMSYCTLKKCLADF